jgi:hypothetical protein
VPVTVKASGVASTFASARAGSLKSNPRVKRVRLKRLYRRLFIMRAGRDSWRRSTISEIRVSLINCT